MSISTKVEIEISPKQLANAWWEMFDDEQAEFYQELYRLSGGSHQLALQSINIREKCKELSQDSIDGFQTIASVAFKYWEL